MQKKSLINENGQISLLGAMAIFIMTLLTLLVFKRAQLGLIRVQKTQHFYLCLKEYNGNLKKYVKEIENDNKILMLLNSGHIPLAILTLGESAYVIEKIKDLIKTKQQLAHVSFLKNIVNMSEEKCPLTPIHYKSPYSQVTSPWALKRNQLGIVIGEKKWELVFFDSHQSIYQQMQIKNGLIIHNYSMK